MFFAKFFNLMKWLKWGGLVLGVIILILAIVPFFISLDDYIPQIEREISARINEPVRIGNLRARGLPLPHITVTGIAVGKRGDIQVGEVKITPELMSLLSSTKVIRSIEIRKLVMTLGAVDKIPLWTKTDAKPGSPAEPPAVRVESIRLDDALLKLENAAFGPFDARLILDGEGNLERASLNTTDGRFEALITPERATYIIDATAKEWKLPVGATILFDELNLKGVATARDATFSEVRARLYGGSVAGNLHFSWQKGLRLRGAAEVNQVEIGALLQALGKPKNMSGKLSASPEFSANAPRADQVADHFRLETAFDIQNGVLHGVDISKAATTLISKDAGKGGETRFDKLSGHLAMSRGTRRLTQLNIVSGSFSADGNVTISPKDALSGRINANVKAVRLATGSVPLNVTGTLDHPLVYPTGGTVAGAAAGTAVLGPGVGTAVGAKVGQWTEDLLGKKEEKKKK
jgi:uncharacterized protein involved in outer membrane biogenesis